MPVLLRSAADYYRRSRLLTQRAITEARRARDRGPAAIVATVRPHQVAGAQLAQAGTRAMLLEQRIATDAEALLNSAAFTTEVNRMAAMIEATSTEYEFDRLVGNLVTDAQRAAQDVQITATPTVTGWVRHLNPPSCPRCTILAGRFYRWSDGFQRHPGCDCIHVPSSGYASSATMVADVDDLVSRGLVHGLSKAALEEHRDGVDLRDIVDLGAHAGLQEAGSLLGGPGRLSPATIRNQAGDDRERRLELLKQGAYLKRGPVAATGSSGGSSQPPAPRARPVGPPDPSDDDLPAWRARQDALRIETNGETLEPDEIRFVERFLRRGERIIEWLARDPRRTVKTNDFIWAFDLTGKDRDAGALAIELKSPKARYRTIANAIRSDADFKQHYIIDLGSRSLTQSLRWQLEKYNQRNGEKRIARLWVLFDDGSGFDEITLK